jgi:hypothetical protein
MNLLILIFIYLDNLLLLFLNFISKHGDKWQLFRIGKESIRGTFLENFPKTTKLFNFL